LPGQAGVKTTISPKGDCIFVEYPSPDLSKKNLAAPTIKQQILRASEGFVVLEKASKIDLLVKHRIHTTPVVIRRLISTCPADLKLPAFELNVQVHCPAVW